MGMVVTQLVFASTLSGDCETLHNRRKVMVRQAGADCLMEDGPVTIILAWQGLYALLHHSSPAADQQISVLGCKSESLRQKLFGAFVTWTYWACYCAGDPGILC